MADKVTFIPATFGNPKKEDIYEVFRKVKNRNETFTVKDIVWYRNGKWVSMAGQDIPDDQVRSWGRRNHEKKDKRRGNHDASRRVQET